MCRSVKRKTHHSNPKLHTKKAFWAENAHIGRNVKIGIYGHRKNTVRRPFKPTICAHKPKRHDRDPRNKIGISLKIRSLVTTSITEN